MFEVGQTVQVKKTTAPYVKRYSELYGFVTKVDGKSIAVRLSGHRDIFYFLEDELRIPDENEPKELTLFEKIKLYFKSLFI